jgi:hypothetical protein
MNIDQAKTIAISEILKTINVLPKKETPIDAWYLSPIRNEKTASFHLNKKSNLWFDHGIGEGGDIIKLVCLYLKFHKESHQVTDALRWIEIMSGSYPKIEPVNFFVVEPNQGNLTLKSTEPLANQALFNYLVRRGIDLNIAIRYLDKVQVYNELSGKTITALGFKNDDGGYELRNPNFKGCLKPKYITFVRGKIPKPNRVQIFEGFMDFLTVLTMKEVNQFKDDVIILNSISCLTKATPYIKDYGYETVCTWMDNDKAGKEATEKMANFFKTQPNLKHIRANKRYKDFKDVNAMHMHNLGLKL